MEEKDGSIPLRPRRFAPLSIKSEARSATAIQKSLQGALAFQETEPPSLVPAGTPSPANERGSGKRLRPLFAFALLPFSLKETADKSWMRRKLSPPL